MARPAALVGKRRATALFELGKGRSSTSIAKELGVSPKTVLKLAREANEIGRERPPKPEHQGEIDFVALLDEDISIRVSMRDTLRQDFDESCEPRERALISKELSSCLDGLRKAVAFAAAPKPDNDEEDADAANFDSFMMGIVAKARVIVDAESRVSSEAEPPRAVGSRTGSGRAVG